MSGVATPVVLTGVHAEEIREGASNAVVVCSHKVTDIFYYAQPCPYLFSSLSCNYHLFYLFLYRNTLPEFNFSRGFPKLVIVIAKSDIPEHNRRRWLSYSLLFVQTSFSLITFSLIHRGNFPFYSRFLVLFHQNHSLSNPILSPCTLWTQELSKRLCEWQLHAADAEDNCFFVALVITDKGMLWKGKFRCKHEHGALQYVHLWPGTVVCFF